LAKSTVESLSKAVVDLTAEEPIRVLHVDDEAGFLKSAKPCLEMQGAFQVETASSVEEAMEKLEEKMFDVVVSDYVMPGKDGLQFLKELREEGNNVPFIIFTGKGKEEIAIKALNLGADRYLNKTGYPETVYGELAYSIRKSVKTKQAEEAIRESQQKFERLFMNNPEAADYLDPDFHILNINPRFEQLFGYSLDEIKGKYINDVIVPKDKMQDAEMLDKEAKNGYTYHDTVRKRKDGSLVSVSISAAPIIIEGQLVGSVGLYKDITERAHAEELLKESEERWRSLAENVPDYITIINRDGKILFVNHTAMGFVKKEVVGSSVYDYTPPEYSVILKKKIEEAFRNSKSAKLEVRGVGTKGTGFTRWYEDYIAPITRNGRVDKVLVVIRDITERKKAEEALKESEEKYRNMVELAPDGIATMNMKGVVTSVNSAFLRLTGFSKDEIVGKHFTKIGTLRARDLPRYIKLFGSIVRGKIPPPMEFAYLRKDGIQCLGEAHSSLLKEGGKIVGFQAILRDTTGRKKTLGKLKMLNEKLSVVGKLTRHDVRNKLSAVINNVYLAKKKLSGEPEALKYLRDVESAVGQVERIFDFARTYEKLGMEELAYMGVKKSLGEAAMLFSDLNGVKVMNDCQGLTVLADSLLRQLFCNLIDNSLKHGEKVSRIRVHYEEAGKNQLRLVYEDDGVGIFKSEKKKIFREGYGKDSGYGLYLIRRICEVYGWTIRETGKQGKGAQFTITIPKMNETGKIAYRLH